MKKTRVLLALALSLVISSSLFAQTKWRQIETFKFDWDGHKDVQIILEHPVMRSAPGDFTRVRIHVPNQKEFTIVNSYGWVPYGSDEASMSPSSWKLKNLVPSKHVLGLEVGKNRTALFLLGYIYASSPGSLHIVEISDSGQPRVVLHRVEFGLEDVRDLDGDSVAEIVGFPCLSQEFRDGLLTYDPFNVYKLGTESATKASLSLVLSKAYNLKHYYGWAGAQCSEKIAVVVHPPRGGKPLVMSTEKAEELMSQKH